MTTLIKHNDGVDLPSLEIVSFEYLTFSKCHSAVFESMYFANSNRVFIL